jgi:deoxyribonuclease V
MSNQESEKGDYIDLELDEWARERPELDLTPMALTARISRLSQLLEHRMQEVYAHFGLDTGKFALLAALRRIGSPYRMSPTYLRRSLLLSPAAVTNRLQRLEADGLVVRLPDAEDRRSLLVALTPEGVRRIDAAIAAHAESERWLMSVVQPAEFEVMIGSLRALLVSQEEPPPFSERRETPALPGPPALARRAHAPGAVVSPHPAADFDWWPDDRRTLAQLQWRLARLVDEVGEWQPVRAELLRIGGAFASLPRGDSAPEIDLAWAAVAVVQGHHVIATATSTRRLNRNYQPGYLALTIGPILEEIARAVAQRPDVLLVSAAGRDHPRGAGLAIQLGAALEMPTIGITDHPVVAVGPEPGHKRGNSSPLYVEDRLVGFRLRTHDKAHAITVHAGWRTNPEVARDLVLGTITGRRTPQPIQYARQLARWLRSESERHSPVAARAR